MQISIDGHHVDVTESMQDYIQTKMTRIERHFDHVVNIHVVLSVEKLRQKVEATIHVARQAPLKRDVFLLSTWEPDFKWKTFVNTLVGYLDGIGVHTLVSLRGRPGEVPHTRPAPVYLTATDIDLELQFGVQSSRTRNEGPSSIAGALAAPGSSATINQTFGYSSTSAMRCSPEPRPETGFTPRTVPFQPASMREQG